MRERLLAARAVALAFVATAACAPAARAADATGSAASSDLVASYVAAWNAAQPAVEDLLTGNFIDSTALFPLDRTLFAMHVAAWRRAIPDLRVSVLERTSAPGRETLKLRFEGSPSRAAEVMPLAGDRVQIEQTEWLTIADGRIQSRRAVADEWTLPVDWMFVAPPAAPIEPYLTRTIARLGQGTFLESVVVASDGRLFVSTGPDGGIVTVDTAGKVAPFAHLDVGAGGFMMCLAFDRDDVLHATVNSRNPELHGIWRFDDSGGGKRIAALPPGSAPNGLAIDDEGNVFVADSFGGVIWRVPAVGGAASVWLRHAWLEPRPLVGRFPGANGLQRTQGAVFVAVSDRSLLLRIPVAGDGNAGTPQVYASGLPGDDFAIAPDGTLYVTTHPFDSVVRVTADGRRVVIAGPAQGIVGPTSAALGADGSLYVAVDGGLFRPLPGVAPVAAVVRLSAPAR